jgi:RNA polymerase sigma factor (sigma-70 family)
MIERDDSPDVTGMLRAWAQGSPGADEELLRAVYQELRRQAQRAMRREASEHTLQATALVHEAYLRLVSRDGGAAPELSEGGEPGSGRHGGAHWDSRGHFFAAAAEAMRRILIDQARHKRSLKRGGEPGQVARIVIEPVATEGEVDVLVLDEALDRLASRDSQAADLVKLRFFAGLTAAEAAAALGVSERTADRIWAYARSFLKKELGPTGA